MAVNLPVIRDSRLLSAHRDSDFINGARIKLTKGLLSVALMCSTLLTGANVSAAEPDVVVVGFGDSITQGSPYNLYPQNGNTFGGYIPTLDNLLERRQSTRVENWGISQESTVEGVRRINSILNARQPDWILIMYGINDLFYGISLQSTMANLRFMINSSRSIGAEPAISNLLPSNFDGSNLVASVYNPQIEALATEMSVYFNNAHSRFAANWPILNNDGVHPNIAGYSLLATTWCETLPICSDDAAPKPGDDPSMSLSLPWLDILLLD